MLMEAMKPDKYVMINTCQRNEIKGFIFFFKILSNGPKYSFYIHASLEGESTYWEIPGASGVAEILKASAR